jgi:hypothetical protein
MTYDIDIQNDNYTNTIYAVCRRVKTGKWIAHRIVKEMKSAIRILNEYAWNNSSYNVEDWKIVAIDLESHTYLPDDGILDLEQEGA